MKFTESQPVHGWKKAYTTNVTTATFPAVVAKTTPFGLPTNNGTTFNGGIPADDKFIKLMFYGVGADNSTVAYRLYGVRCAGTQNLGVANPLYIPELVLEGVATLSTLVGVAASPVLDTENFADTITVTTPATAARPAIEYFLANSVTANISPATVSVSTQGYGEFYLVFDMTGATSANALWTTTS